ncbi:hypothetical protein M2317_000287 [Microbacterium sp. ZKA21]|uniref:hypothetical protein n=1 Tax=Microbacterium sp. ZKA21 TaxID=3381694 RepID=UPI003D238F54
MGRTGLIGGVGIGILIVALVGCAPEAVPSASPMPSPSTSASGEPTPAPEPSEAVSLPESCDQVFSPALREKFEGAGLPLNDPTLTMPSTELAGAVEVLAALDNLRCTWGVASEVGIATTLAMVDTQHTTDLQEAFTTQGLECEEVDGATRCTIRVSFDDEGGGGGAGGEIHLLRDGVWVATKWLNADMTGYLDDIEATLWP